MTNAHKIEESYKKHAEKEKARLDRKAIKQAKWEEKHPSLEERYKDVSDEALLYYSQRLWAKIVWVIIALVIGLFVAYCLHVLDGRAELPVIYLIGATIFSITIFIVVTVIVSFLMVIAVDTFAPACNERERRGLGFPDFKLFP